MEVNTKIPHRFKKKSNSEARVQLPRAFPILGYETNRFFLLDLDKRISLEEVKKIAFEIGKKYGFGDCLIVHSSDGKQLMLDLKPLQNYNLIYGKKVPFDYQQWVLKELRDSGTIRDIRYVEFREKEGSSTLRVSPKYNTKRCGKPIAFLKITGENVPHRLQKQAREGIKEYLKMLWVGRKLEKYLEELSCEESDENWKRELSALDLMGVIKA